MLKSQLGHPLIVSHHNPGCHSVICILNGKLSQELTVNYGQIDGKGDIRKFRYVQLPQLLDCIQATPWLSLKILCDVPLEMLCMDVLLLSGQEACSGIYTEGLLPGTVHRGLAPGCRTQAACSLASAWSHRPRLSSRPDTSTRLVFIVLCIVQPST